ncbi:alpha/beta hydrolase [Paenibacillus sp. N3/727]|uniref:alpha/beta fold hydrolase n=1 Tax=Paenibacillus sp. N3/727 TaxID=2925845 RepID=UPI001F53DCA1|nr:alpha/beta hydrolase [Paenibacillus sp. N3/727]UNK18287.1 alpha/beta hydrolase [Paenibacillus sp. N3/727]
MIRNLFKRKHRLIWITFIFALILLWFFPSWTPKIRDEAGKVISGSVAILERVELGGKKQSILIRGNDSTKPVILFLHGGPGYPQIAYARKYQKELEKDFIVVNWDQRGAGKSYHWGMTEEDLQIDRLVEDTHELTAYLRTKFNQSKIFVAGHSWGSLLATWTVQKYPGDYYAYIGIGQVAHSPEGEQVSYNFVLQEAKRTKNDEALKELESIGSPPYQHPRKDTTLERKWVTAFGGSERNISSYKDLIKGVLFAPEYTWLDGVRLAIGDSVSRHAIMPQTKDVNLFESVPELKVPVYIMMGRTDYMTPSEVAYRYYEELKAPAKQFIWFEGSAHFPHFEETDKFTKEMLRIQEEILGDSIIR